LSTEHCKKPNTSPGSEQTHGRAGDLSQDPHARASATDQELDIERSWLILAQIDTEKFLYFYDKYYDTISRFIYRKTFDPDMTEELTSRTFFRALDKLWQFRWRGISFGAWLYRIALNEVLLERRSKILTHQPLPGELEPTCPRRTQLSQMIFTEEQLQVRECLKRLDETSQNIIILHYWEGMSLKAIQAILNKPSGTIKSKLKRARDALKRMLMEEQNASSTRCREAPNLRIIPGGMSRRRPR
jgi:RNA polymerase sigma-70 factor (ECF subfamily)